MRPSTPETSNADRFALDPLDIYDILLTSTKYVRDIRDPEHPYSLEQLSALSEDSITLNDKLNRVLITFTPTIQHCSMSTIIGLRLRAKLKECLPLHYKVDTKVSPGSHAVEHSEEDLLKIPRGERTLEGLRLNRRVGVQYLAAWLTGSGYVPLYNLMEDTAPAEIRRVQNWQWIRYEVELDGDGLGVRVNKELFGRVVEEEMERIEKKVGKDKFKKGMYKEACKKFTKQCTASELDDFLTLAVYDHIVAHYPINVSRP
ncbi:hypothetical protein HID58_071110 [Brassica napus]|uniref:Malate synthase n=1 Tax=Brassica napus TaxID=3708 RepID=A0ABQ7Z0R9_BRANA|nr:hypothetical protein HID58_071110 [Brassica napus]